MTHTITPRPVAWILTRNENATYNLAPFSYFQSIGSQPPTVMVSIGFKHDGTKKDTQINIERERDYVIHIPSTSLAPQVNLSAKPLAYNESETELCNLETTTVDGWPLPRITQAPVAFHCQLSEVNVIAGMNVIFGELKEVWISDEVLMPAPMSDDFPDLPDPVKLDPLARLGYMSYARLSHPFELERPS
ncbi:flavin reductase family protein [Cerasicoccus maritimus]|uniref:flavin reductase family protein n=1 Tax=Cerasicoccus maritimus TaxID=490089 RepID=UPI0028528BFE|nr:flavin reductase family protein [Cerasicoccus maritimus]